MCKLKKTRECVYKYMRYVCDVCMICMYEAYTMMACDGAYYIR